MTEQRVITVAALFSATADAAAAVEAVAVVGGGIDRATICGNSQGITMRLSSRDGSVLVNFSFFAALFN